MSDLQNTNVFFSDTGLHFESKFHARLNRFVLENNLSKKWETLLSKAVRDGMFLTEYQDEL